LFKRLNYGQCGRRDIMARKNRSIKKKLRENEDYSDILDIIGQDDDISDEDVALYANIDIDTVERIREKWVNEELVNPYKKQPGRN